MWKVAISVALVTVFARTSVADDVDEDTLDDSLEAVLINTYRPWLYYDSQNAHWPTSALAYLRESELQSGGDVIVERDAMRLNPLLALTGVLADGRSSDDVLYAGRSAFNIDSDVPRFGVGPVPIGTYAHCFILTDNTDQIVYAHRECCPVGDAGDIVIQYWQFFAYNDSQAPSCCEFYCPGACDWGDHEGDWLYLDVFVDGATYALKHIVYHHHGDSTCAVSILPGDIGACGAGLDLPQDGIPRCYLERGSHEWWPAVCSQDCSPGGQRDSCDGAGPNYRTQNVINVGERYRPMPDLESQVFVLLNAKWGGYTGDRFADPPECPSHQSGPGFFVAPFWTVHMSPQGFTPIEGTPNGLGAPRAPLARLADAVGKVQPAGILRLGPGSYTGVGNRGVTITRACSLSAPVGPATFGR